MLTDGIFDRMAAALNAIMPIRARAMAPYLKALTVILFLMEAPQ
jgi:hypothetical protein